MARAYHAFYISVLPRLRNFETSGFMIGLVHSAKLYFPHRNISPRRDDVSTRTATEQWVGPIGWFPISVKQQLLLSAWLVVYDLGETRGDDERAEPGYLGAAVN